MSTPGAGADLDLIAGACRGCGREQPASESLRKHRLLLPPVRPFRGCQYRMAVYRGALPAKGTSGQDRGPGRQAAATTGPRWLPLQPRQGRAAPPTRWARRLPKRCQGQAVCGRSAGQGQARAADDGEAAAAGLALAGQVTGQARLWSVRRGAGGPGKAACFGELPASSHRSCGKCKGPGQRPGHRTRGRRHRHQADPHHLRPGPDQPRTTASQALRDRIPSPALGLDHSCEVCSRYQPSTAHRLPGACDQVGMRCAGRAVGDGHQGERGRGEGHGRRRYQCQGRGSRPASSAGRATVSR